MSLDSNFKHNVFHNLTQLSVYIHNVNVEKGFWDCARNEGELIALIHSELSEALEAIRNGNPSDDKIPHYTGATAELADAIIRILDMAEGMGYDVPSAVLAKLEYNMTRDHKHGKQF